MELYTIIFTNKSNSLVKVENIFKCDYYNQLIGLVS